MCVSRILALLAATIIVGLTAFVSVLVWIAPPAKDVAAGGPKVGTHCEIELGPDRCPGLPSIAKSGSSRVFFDTWETAGIDVARCMSRAAEYHAGCKSRYPVTARFLEGREVVKTVTVP
jgi:hypothetical protein